MVTFMRLTNALLQIRSPVMVVENLCELKTFTSLKHVNDFIYLLKVFLNNNLFQSILRLHFSTQPEIPDRPIYNIYLQYYN